MPDPEADNRRRFNTVELMYVAYGDLEVLHRWGSGREADEALTSRKALSSFAIEREGGDRPMADQHAMRMNEALNQLVELHDLRQTVEKQPCPEGCPICLAESLLAADIGNSAKVRAFHLAMGQEDPSTPTIPTREVIDLRIKLMREELKETVDAFADDDLPEVVDGLIDLLYVTHGTLLACGVDDAPAFAEVHRTNMLKKHGPIRGDGKYLKPEGWTPPDIAGVLRSQGWDG